jgi:hypothetical protein
MSKDDEAEALENFEAAFRDRGAGCVRQCDCGRIYYNPSGEWTWEPGELEKLEANPNATASVYAIGAIVFEGRWYADHCECWKERARKIVAFLKAHDEQIAEFLTLERKRKQAEADRAPVIRA